MSVLARTYMTNCEGIRNAVNDLKNNVASERQFFREKHRDSLHRNLVIALHNGVWMFFSQYVKNWEQIKWS